MAIPPTHRLQVDRLTIQHLHLHVVRAPQLAGREPPLALPQLLDLPRLVPVVIVVTVLARVITVPLALLKRPERSGQVPPSKHLNTQLPNIRAFVIVPPHRVHRGVQLPPLPPLPGKKQRLLPLAQIRMGNVVAQVLRLQL